MALANSFGEFSGRSHPLDAPFPEPSAPVASGQAASAAAAAVLFTVDDFIEQVKGEVFETSVEPRFVSDVNGKIWRISYSRKVSSGARSRIRLRSRLMRVRPTLSVHATSAISSGLEAWYVTFRFLSSSVISSKGFSNSSARLAFY